MNPFSFTPGEVRFLVVLAVLGFLVPNGVFLWFLFTAPGLLRAALTNPLSLVFILEAFFLMFLFAWLVRKAGLKRPSAFGFILLSLFGSLACSVPAVLALNGRKPDDQTG